MPTPLQNFRADVELWDGADEVLRSLTGPRRVVVTIRPGMSRSAALVAFLMALTRRPR